MTSLEIKAAAQDIIARSPVVILASTDPEGFPMTRVMFNLHNPEKFPGLIPFMQKQDEPFVIYLSTNTSSVKIRQLASRDKTALQYLIPDEFLGLMIQGTISTVDDLKTKHEIYQPGWEIYYPLGPDDPDYTVLKLEPMRLRGWLAARGKFDLTAEKEHKIPQSPHRKNIWGPIFI